MRKKTIGFRAWVTTENAYRILNVELWTGHIKDYAKIYKRDGIKWDLERLQELREKHDTTLCFASARESITLRSPPASY